jgi:hypothetical protein
MKGRQAAKIVVTLACRDLRRRERTGGLAVWLIGARLIVCPSERLSNGEPKLKLGS